MLQFNKEMLVNQNNIAIWEKTTKYHGQINIIKSNETWAYCEVKNGLINIGLTEENIQEAFDHELLHLFLESLGISTTSMLINFSNQYQSLNFIDYGWWDETANLLNHVHMFPLFLKLGHNADLFITDFHESKVQADLIQDLQRGGQIARTTFNGRQLLVQYMLQGYSSMRSCPNSSYDYTSHFILLNEIDPILYKIIESFWDSWLSLDVNDDFVGATARSTIDTFMIALNRYITKN